MNEIKLYKRPGIFPLVDKLRKIITELTPKWFTENVLEDTVKDLSYQDLLCLYHNSELVSFLIFTSWDGAIHITLMATKPGYQHNGLGSQLINYLCSLVKKEGFQKIVVLTVPEESKSCYKETIAFYEKNQFKKEKIYHELWESGAIKLVRNL